MFVVVLVFLLFFGKIFSLDGPSIVGLLNDSRDFTVKEGGSITFSCVGDRVLDWRFPGRNYPCYDTEKISEIGKRVQKSNLRTWSKSYRSKMTLTAATFLDAGPVECFYVESPTSADSFYLFVNSSQNFLMPCMRPGSKSCRMPSKDMNRPVPVSLKDENDFAPCRPSSKSVELEINLEQKYEHVTSLKWTVDPTKGFQLQDVAAHNVTEYIISCRPKNRPEAKFCYMKLQYRALRQSCQVELRKTQIYSLHQFEESRTQFFAGSSWNLTCEARCRDFPTDFRLNLVKFSPNPEEIAEKILANNYDHDKVEKRDLNDFRADCNFVLENVNPNRDDGVYSCQLSLPPDKSFVSNATFSVKTPKEPVFLNENVTAEFTVSNKSSDGNETVFDCWADGVPRPRYRWFHNSLENHLNNETSGQLVRKELSPGSFICQVENSFGSVLSRTFHIFDPNSGSADKMIAEAGISHWIIAIIAAVCLGMVLAIVLLGLFVAWRLRRKNRSAVLKALWKQYFSEVDGFVPLPDQPAGSITLATPRSLSLSLLTNLNSSRDSTEVDRIVSQNSNLETGEISSLGDVLEEVPYSNNVYEIDPNKLDFQEVLGRGAFGVVYKADLKLFDPDHPVPVAVKCIRDSFDTSQYKALISEIKLLASVGCHVNIVNLVGAVTKKLQDGILYMILEFCEGGSLRSFLSIHRDRFFETDEFDYFTLKQQSVVMPDVPSDDPEYCVPSGPSLRISSGTSDVNSRYVKMPTKNAAYYRTGDNAGAPLLDRNSSSDQRNSGGSVFIPAFGDVHRERISKRDLTIFSYQIASGMQFLHDRHCLHRDLAARNVLVCAGNILKITDFGLAKQIFDYDGQYQPKLKGAKVPWKWLPPESLEYQTYNKQTDIWSFGVLVWEIFTLGKVPYSPEFDRFDESFIQRLKEEYRLPKPDSADDDMWRVMLLCWHSQPKSRPSFRTLKEEIRKKLPAETVRYYEGFNFEKSEKNVLPGIPEETPVPRIDPPPPVAPRRK